MYKKNNFYFELLYFKIFILTIYVDSIFILTLSLIFISNLVIIWVTSLFLFFFIFIFYKIEIIFQLNLSIYVCGTFHQRLEPQALHPTLYNHLYLWSDHCAKGVWQYEIRLLMNNTYLALNGENINRKFGCISLSIYKVHA